MLRILIASIVVGSVVVLFRAADSSARIPEPMAQALEGVWVHVGEPGNVDRVPQSEAPHKFRFNGHWTFTQADPAAGTVKQHFGGNYRLRGTEYFEIIVYSTDPDDPELKRTLKFTVKVEGDRMTQTGVGNPYTEVWKRVR